MPPSICLISVALSSLSLARLPPHGLLRQPPFPTILFLPNKENWLPPPGLSFNVVTRRLSPRTKTRRLESFSFPRYRANLHRTTQPKSIRAGQSVHSQPNSNRWGSPPVVRFPPRFCSLLQQITAVAPAVLEETHQPDLPEQLNCYFLTVGSSFFQPAFPHFTLFWFPSVYVASNKTILCTSCSDGASSWGRPELLNERVSLFFISSEAFLALATSPLRSSPKQA